MNQGRSIHKLECSPLILAPFCSLPRQNNRYAHQPIAAVRQFAVKCVTYTSHVHHIYVTCASYICHIHMSHVCAPSSVVILDWLVLGLPATLEAWHLGNWHAQPLRRVVLNKLQHWSNDWHQHWVHPPLLHLNNSIHNEHGCNRTSPLHAVHAIGRHVQERVDARAVGQEDLWGGGAVRGYDMSICEGQGSGIRFWV